MAIYAEGIHYKINLKHQFNKTFITTAYYLKSSKRSVKNRLKKIFGNPI